MFWRKPNKTLDERRQKATDTFNKAKTLFDKGEIDAAISLSHAARDLFEAAKDNEGLGRAEDLIGDILTSIGQYSFAEKAYERATVAFKAPEDDAETFRELAEVKQFQGKREDALESYQKALALYKKINDQTHTAQISRQVAYLLYEQEQWAEAEKYYREALRLADATGAQDLKDSMMLEIGNAIAQQGRIDEARHLFEQSANQARTTNDPDTLADALHSLAVTFVAQGQRDRAHALYEESLKLNQASGDKAGIAYTLYEMGINTAERGQKDEGVKLIEQAITLYDELGAPEVELARSTLAQYRAA